MDDKNLRTGGDTNATTRRDYDEMPYPAAPYPQTHPNQLATLAMLFGMNPAPVPNCRVLELGCGNGSNLIALAAGLPESHFVGIDLSRHEIELAQQTLKALQLNNIEIKHANIMDINKEWGQFDYIIAHGIYSWVPPDVRKRCLQVCRELLAKNGVAFISYNVYPGWSAYSMVRNILLYHVRNIKNPKEAVAKARQFLKDMAEMAPSEGDNHYYSEIFKTIAKRTETWLDNYFRHDIMGDINHPFYFYQFVEAAEVAGLQYLAEADFHSMVPTNISEKSLPLLQSLGDNRIAKEQHLDFLFNRMFRETLLCHQEIKLTPHIDMENFRQMYFSAPIIPLASEAELHTTEKVSFSTLPGVNITAHDRLEKILWAYLSMQWPKANNIATIAHQIKRILEAGTPEEKALANNKELTTTLLSYLWNGYVVGLIKLYLHPLPLTLEVSSHPKASAIARYQASKETIATVFQQEKRAIWVTNQLHEYITIDNFQHHILQYLDGTRSHDDLLNILLGLEKAGKIHMDRNGKSLPEDEIKQILHQQLELSLVQFARLGLLIA